jgi:hypothetical protein
MPSPPDPEIQFWFTQLGRFQAACINNSTSKLNLLQFANANIVSMLSSPNEQKNFLTAVAASTGYDDLQIADVPGDGAQPGWVLSAAGPHPPRIAEGRGLRRCLDPDTALGLQRGF